MALGPPLTVCVGVIPWGDGSHTLNRDGVAGRAAMLSVRRRAGLPPRRRLGVRYLTIISVIIIIAGLTVGSRSGPVDGLLAATAALMLPFLLAPLWLVWFAIGRSRLRRLRDELDLAAECIAVRTTADFSSFPPAERKVFDTYVRPWTTYQVLTQTPDAMELRTFPRMGWSGGARLRFDRVARIDVGSADFGDLRERAIIVSGTERGRDYALGIVPVSEQSLLLAPVSDQQFRDFADELITAAQTTVVLRRS